MRKKENNKERDLNLIAMGRRLAKARLQVGLNQNELGEKIGMSKSQLCGYETGANSIGLKSIADIAMATGTSIDELYFGKDGERIITTAVNKGQLIANCIMALWEENVISVIPKEKKKNYSSEFIETVSIVNYEEIIRDLIYKLDDLQRNIDTNPDPEKMRRIFLEQSANKINKSIECSRDKLLK